MSLESSKKVLSKSFVENHVDVNEDVAAELIISAELKIKAIKEERNADEKLAQAKQIVKDLNGAYTSTIKYEEAKIDFLLEKIEEIQSGAVNPSSGANA
jgi:alpha-amylase/alpha-mannosidase (GH57 family)